jgi:hypothetical protein
VQRLLKKNSEPHTGARPSVRLCVGPELARCVHRGKHPDLTIKILILMETSYLVVLAEVPRTDGEDR